MCRVVQRNTIRYITIAQNDRAGKSTDTGY